MKKIDKIDKLSYSVITIAGEKTTVLDEAGAKILSNKMNEIIEIINKFFANE